VAQHETRGVSARDGQIENVIGDKSIGLSVRLLLNGAWGFGATDDLTQAGARQATERAIAMAKSAAQLTRVPISLANEPSHGQQSWRLAVADDAFAHTDSEYAQLLIEWSQRLLAHKIVDHVEANTTIGRDTTYFSDLTGNSITQQRDRIHSALTAIHVGSNGFEDMRTCAPPAGRGWEYLAGSGWDWESELAQLPIWLAEKVAAPSVAPGLWDLVIDPTNLWLTIHESIGHATELDRALGYEANYAGTSFATTEKLGNFQYGSSMMNVTGDRNTPHGLATVGFDDEGVSAQQWHLIKDGVLTDYQVDRATAAVVGRDRSNGCAFADSAHHVPLQRMPNVSLQPDPNGPDTAGLISQVERGIYVVGDKSWSIDMQRYNFQFTGQRFFEIREGAIVGQLKDVAYQSRTPDFWNSMSAVGGPDTYLLGGALNCGKGQPGQTAPVSHGCPSALFRNINILNTAHQTAEEA
jgi:TldD protein